MYEMLKDWRKLIVAVTWTSWISVRSMYWDSEDGQEELRSYAELGKPACQISQIISNFLPALDPGNPKETESLHETFEKVLGDNEVPIGCIAPGFAADIIATDGDLEKDFESAITQTKISFVMKNGVVYKRDGIPRI